MKTREILLYNKKTTLNIRLTLSFHNHYPETLFKPATSLIFDQNKKAASIFKSRLPPMKN